MATMARRPSPKLAGGTPEGPVRIESLKVGDVASAVELVRRVQRVDPGDRGEQFAADITDDSRQMFVAKAKGHVVAHARVAELAADEAAPGTPAGCYLSGVLVDPAWRRRGIATALTRARLRWVFNRTDEALCVIGADNIASLRLHAALGSRKSSASGANGPLSGWTYCRASPERRHTLTSFQRVKHLPRPAEYPPDCQLGKSSPARIAGDGRVRIPAAEHSTSRVIWLGV
jgi:aminoglycoside 6'-N-acetyltransferase I